MSLSTAITELVRSRRVNGTVISVGTNAVVVRITGGAVIPNVRVVGTMPGIGDIVLVEWNGYEPIVSLPTSSSSAGAISYAVEPSNTGTVPATGVFDSAGWVTDEDGVIYNADTYKCEIHPDGVIKLGGTGGIVLNPSVPEIQMGGATGFETGTGIWMGQDLSTYKFYVGNAGTNQYMSWDGTTLTVTGDLVGSSDISGTVNDTFTINDDNDDVTVKLIMARTTGGDAELQWEGTKVSLVHGGSTRWISSSTGLGVGMTAINAKLEVQSDGVDEAVQQWVASDGSTLARIYETGAGNGYFNINDSAGSEKVVFRTDTGDNYIAYGNVGIGMTSPDELLHVRGSQGTLAKFSDTSLSSVLISTNNQDSRIIFQDNDASVQWAIGIDESAGLFSIGTGTGVGSAGFRIDSSYNVGIGTVPSYKLDLLSADGVIGLLVGDSATDASDKQFRAGARHYTNAEEPTALFFVNNVSAENILTIGGGTALFNAVTRIGFYTATDTTTTTGTTRMTITNDGNVSIGTTVPLGRLHVKGTADDQQLIVQANATQTADILQVQDSGGYGDIFVIKGDENIGIGTTSPNISGFPAGSDYRIVTIEGSSRGMIELSSRTPDSDNITVGDLRGMYTSADSGYRDIAAILFVTDGSTANKRGGEIGFFTQPDNSSSLTQRMTVRESGNVGIGTDSPVKLLSIAADNPEMELWANNGAVGRVSKLWLGATFGSGGDTWSRRFGKIEVGSSGSDWTTPYMMFSLQVNDTPTYTTVMTLTNARVGIGTDTPGYMLDVSGEAVFGANHGCYLYDDSGISYFAGRNNSLKLITIRDGDDIILTANSIDSLFIDSATNYVGIGTNAPGAKLEIVGTTDDQQLIVRANATQTANVVEVRDSAGNPDIFVIDERGYVGIGISDPGTELNVKSSGDSEIRITSGLSPYIRLLDETNNISWYISNRHSDANGYWLINFDGTNWTTPFKIDDSSPTDSIHIRSDGNIDIGGDLEFQQTSTISTTTGNLTIAPTADLHIDPTGQEVIFDNWNAGDSIESDTYASQTTGWAISYGTSGGHADFRSMYADELHVKAFVAEIYSALAGALIITKSRGRLSRDMVIPLGRDIVNVDGDVSGAAIVIVHNISDYFEIAGNESSNISVGDKFTVAGSTGNDGVWTVSACLYDDPNTRIEVDEDIISGTADGTITFHHYFTIAGDQTSKITGGTHFYIKNSTGNDGGYYEDSVYYDSGNNETDIYPTTAIPSLVGDGVIGLIVGLYMEDLEGWENVQVFYPGDYIRLRHIDMSGGGLIVTDAWGYITGYTDQTGGEQRWWFIGVDDGGVDGEIIHAGSIALDYGRDDMFSRGVWEATVLDTAGAPYSQVKTWDDNPWTPANWTVNVRLGNLDGISGVGLEYGLWAGDGTGDGDAYLLLSDTNVEIHNIPLEMHDSSTPVISLTPSNASSDPSLAIGVDSDAITYAANTGIWMGRNSGNYKFRVGDPAGVNLDYNGSWFFIGDDNTNSYIALSTSGIGLYSNSVKTISLDTSGNATFGKVATDSGNIHWNVGNERLEFRGGTSGTEVQAYVDTDGSIMAAADHLMLDATGLTLKNTDADTGRIRWYETLGSGTPGMTIGRETGSGLEYFEIAVDDPDNITGLLTLSVTAGTDVTKWYMGAGISDFIWGYFKGVHVLSLTDGGIFHKGNTSLYTSNLVMGVSDSVCGSIELHGYVTGHDDGAKIFLHMSADHDTTYDNYLMMVYEDDLRFYTNGGSPAGGYIFELEPTGTITTVANVRYKGNLQSNQGGSDYDVYGMCWISATDLYDNQGTPVQWAGGQSVNAGTYVFNADANGNSWPTYVKRVLVLVQAQFSNAGDNIIGRYQGSSTTEGIQRCQNTSIPVNEQWIIDCSDGFGDFEIVLSANATNCLCRMLGYWI